AQMIIGVPKERLTDEYRVAITPAGVRELTAAGHSVHVAQGAGTGCTIPGEVWAAADLILKVKEPVPEEYDRLSLRTDQVLFTYLHLAASRACTDALVAAGNTAIAYETVQLPDQSLPLLIPTSA